MREKRYFIFALFVAIFVSINAKSQVHINVFATQPPALHANAGSDTLICTPGSTILGGMPSASGGSPGYIYSWYPATGLSSATVANPVASITDTTTYTITVTDAQGCTASGSVTVFTTICTGTSADDTKMNVNFFPNPSNGFFMLQISGKEIESSLNLSISNESGKEVYSEHLVVNGNNLSKQIDVSALSKGTYFLRLRGMKTDYIKKCVIN